MVNDLWSSDRLIYRAADEDGDAQFLREMMMSDSTDFVGAAPFAPTPMDLESCKKILKLFLEAKVAAIACIKPESKTTPSGDDIPPAVPPKDGGDEGAKKAGEPKPTPIGFVAIRPIDPRMAHHRHGVVSIHMHHRFENKGYGTEMMKWVMNWGFKYGGLHKLSLTVYTWNPRAIHVYEKVGFVTEGRHRESYWVEGEWRDSLEMAILEQEWRAKYPEDAKPRPSS